MKAIILVTPKFGGRQHVLGPYTSVELVKKLEKLSDKYDTYKVMSLNQFKVKGINEKQKNL